MKKIIAILILITVFGCSSESGPGTDVNAPEINQLYLSKIIETDIAGNGSIRTTVLNYNGDRLNTIVGSSSDEDAVYKTEYVYENDKATKLKRFENDVYQPKQDLNFVYDGNNILTSSGYDNSSILFSHQYKYNGKNQMITDAQYDDGKYNSEKTYTYFINGNVESVSHSAFSGVHYYTFDDKINPMYFTVTEPLAKIYGWSKNNPTSNGNNTFDYEYNSQGYPIKITEKREGNIIISVQVLEY